METKIQIVIVDDHPIFRKGLIQLLSEIYYVSIVGEASNGLDFIEKIKKIDVDLVFMDIKMPVINGIEATKMGLDIFPKMKIIALTMFGDEEYFQSMLDAGVNGFLLKNASKDELEMAIKSVMEGNSYYSSELLSILTKRFVKKEVAVSDEKLTKNSFTKREAEVLQLICQGMTNQEIANLLFISQRTVDGHRTNLLTKTQAKNTVNMVTQAIKNRWIETSFIDR
jgi:DNA-binding NarL/FixJ family response regulator